MNIVKLPAAWMRGGTSKGLFLCAKDLPADPAVRDALLVRALGSPDPYGKQIDGIGGATSSTSKVVIVAPSTREDCDVEYRFGAVAIDRPAIDWSGNCGNLTAAVGPFAILRGLVPAPDNGIVTVRLWQDNIGKRIEARVPVAGGEVLECGDFRLDGVAFPGAPIELTFLDPAGGAGAPLLPTGLAAETLTLPDGSRLAVTLINAGNPMIFADAVSFGLQGNEPPGALDQDAALLARCEMVRATAAVRMGLAASPEEATRARPHTPKLALVAAPRDYRAADGRRVAAGDIDCLLRMVSMGRWHHAMTGTGGVAAAAAAALPGTLVEQRVGHHPCRPLRIGHASGVLTVTASSAERDGQTVIASVTLRRSARCLMDGVVRVPVD